METRLVLPLPRLLTSIDTIRDALNSEIRTEFSTAVVGKSGAGKSLFTNACVNHKVLVASDDVEAVTPCPIRIIATTTRDEHITAEVLFFLEEEIRRDMQNTKDQLSAQQNANAENTNTNTNHQSESDSGARLRRIGSAVFRTGVKEEILTTSTIDQLLENLPSRSQLGTTVRVTGEGDVQVAGEGDVEVRGTED